MNKEELFKLIEEEGECLNFDFKGYKCEIQRHPTMKHLCGYVLVDSDHWLYGKDYEDIESKYSIYSHGGLTYSRNSEEMWKIGFDCAHLYDLVPANYNMEVLTGINTIHPKDVYRDMKYVRQVLEAMVTDIIRSY